jgi:hypothetical protein
METPRPGGARGAEKSIEAGNLKAHSAAQGASQIAERSADSIRLQALGQIGGA